MARTVRLEITAIGVPASGKSITIRHICNNPPEGYKLDYQNAVIPPTSGAEHWTVVFKPKKRRKK